MKGRIESWSHEWHEQQATATRQGYQTKYACYLGDEVGSCQVPVPLKDERHPIMAATYITNIDLQVPQSPQLKYWPVKQLAICKILV